VVQYLSSEWVARLAELGAGLPEVPGATATVEVVVPGSPTGEVRYVVRYVDGRVAEASLGAADGPDVSLTTKYADAVRLLRGDLDLNAEFMSGRMKVAGSTGRLLDVLSLDGTPEHRAMREELAAATDT
jgi:hypothetical protein